jgi:hypothetical protein
MLSEPSSIRKENLLEEPVVGTIARYQCRIGTVLRLRESGVNVSQNLGGADGAGGGLDRLSSLVCGCCFGVAHIDR